LPFKCDLQRYTEAGAGGGSRAATPAGSYSPRSSTPAGSHPPTVPAYDLPHEPRELAALWTKLTNLITVEAPGWSPHRGVGGAASPEGGGGGGEGEGAGGLSSPKYKSKSLTEMMATLQERVMSGDSLDGGGGGGGGGGGVGKFFPWADSLVNEELSAQAIDRSAGPAAPVKTLACWLSGLLVAGAVTS
jgi:hypothetical protein